ncbi:hypothetical protein TVAG_311000 [Trichomonas vaginalis G3]|uniref:Uncharacterized protein n=1 Tax=Trichomonas vaginalis (strain ATCC PRA-98 / G3) TaxID=412133 RepID=A2FHV5_TRIV3|nr:hypothetical protein TVAGG3_0780770 [Trichomonas vaginalis G3]EAX95528.1 hypothetical protein TVAG_311000 [Trichomonas vaginalis G3]KAI5495031.1 hypothetical protein TVAGG3_0780770 [Trichomonas vaginalis G3]|eukprot:XP_001308458.1 hypothetical protein [Trichomonas vaginalis G3]
MEPHYLKALYPEQKKIKHHRTFKCQTTRDNEKIKKRIKINKNRINFINEYLNKFFSTNVTTTILISFAKLLSSQLNLTLDRLAKRNRTSLLCWYSENWNSIYYILNTVDFPSFIRKIPKEEEIQVSNMQPSCIDPSDLSYLLNYH